jgi:cysteine desulfurase
MAAKKSNPLIYADNNATTLICEPAAKAHIDWLRCYNPSTDSKIVTGVKNMIESTKHYILNHCGTSSSNHTLVFTSGATESNCFILRSCVKAFKRKLSENGSPLLPHIISSCIEHHSILDCLEELEQYGDAEVTLIKPTIYGNILPRDVEMAIKPNTCLISIMFANNEIPTINNIREIGAIAHKNKIPLHSDCVQVFGKFPIDVIKNNIDVLSASAHKFYGSKGIGILIVNNMLIEGYQLGAEINGTQQHGLRGGTENVSGIADCGAALQYVMKRRSEKNERLLFMRETFLKRMGELYPFGNYQTYVQEDKASMLMDPTKGKPPIELLSLGPPAEDERARQYILPNTILLSICKNQGKPFCNVELKKFLDHKNIVVSIGSACQTKADKASHVVRAIGAPPVVRRGILRISFGDTNTPSEAKKIAEMIAEGIEKQCSDIIRE